MKIWLITDTHFGHKNMIPYCSRPENFEDLIFKNLINTVNSDDILIHLGDFCFGDDEQWHDKFMSLVCGHKWLIRGNHDHKTNKWYMEHGWDFIGKTLSDIYFGKHILFSHAPKNNSDFTMNIHGHFHNSLHRLLEGKYIDDGERERNKEDMAILNSKHKLLAIEYTEYKPVLLEEFIK
jgi:calcineurin-like phosphoesterase family protein